MKITSLSDIHGDFETFDKAGEIIKASDADVVAITGDIAGGVFEGDEKELFVKIQDLMYSNAEHVMKIMEDKIKSMHDVAGFLASGYDKNVPDNLKEKAKQYLDMEKTGEERLSWQYRIFKKKLDALGKPVVLVPGNWDSKCLESILSEECIHGKTKEIGGVKFTGFGGAPITPREMPVNLLYGFDEDEAFLTLNKHEDAEVVLTHANPRFFEGKNAFFKGEYALLTNLHRNTPSLMLTGHSHSCLWAKENKAGTVVLNPGNLGRYENQPFGTFFELELDDNLFVKPLAFYRINGTEVHREDLAIKS